MMWYKEDRYLKPAQKEYMMRYGPLMTKRQLADALGLNYQTILSHCKRNDIETTKSFFQAEPPPVPTFEQFLEENYMPEEMPKPKSKRWPAVYDNKSREDYINDILNR